LIKVSGEGWCIMHSYVRHLHGIVPWINHKFGPLGWWLKTDDN